jgi:hypothetical protein
MTALANERQGHRESWQSHLFTLASGNKAWKNALIGIDLGSGKVVPATTRTDLFIIGVAAETVDATSADKLLNVRLAREIWVDWLNNDATSIVATDLGALCYLKDDQSVTITPTGASVAGRVWAVDSARGVAVEMLDAVPAGIASLTGLIALETALTAFSSNNINLPATPVSGAMYEVPATGAASTITLPATADEGTVLYFVANGTDNAHTVQYRDATGPTNITTALTASKRHMVIAAFLNSAWRANAYVSP